MRRAYPFTTQAETMSIPGSSQKKYRSKRLNPGRKSDPVTNHFLQLPSPGIKTGPGEDYQVLQARQEKFIQSRVPEPGEPGEPWESIAKWYPQRDILPPADLRYPSTRELYPAYDQSSTLIELREPDNAYETTGKFIDPKSDFGFKFLFGSELRKDFLISLLRAIFETTSRSTI